MSNFGQVDLEYIIRNKCYKIVPFIDADNFVSYCEQRGIITSMEDLERYEELGIFYPLARVKIEEEKPLFSFTDDAQEWFEKGLMWDPHTVEFQKWDDFFDGNGDKKVKSYYSIFQCYSLYQLIENTRLYIDCTSWISYNDENLSQIIDVITKRSNSNVAFQKKHVHENAIIPLFCQVLSNRYYPLTQNDMRRISVSTPGSNVENWDWFEFCKSWESKSILDNMEKTPDFIRSNYNSVISEASSIDPMQRWYELINFISVKQKDKLKNEALLAQTFYSMAKMLKLYYEELTGEQLPDADERGREWKQRFYGEGVTDNKLQYLEFLTNRYHLNPKPNLVLIVEGYGEEKHIPRLAKELWGVDFSTIGIEIINLQGINNLKGSGYKRLIDYYHNRQTIVFVIVDKEGKISSIKKDLIESPSIYKHRKDILVTKDEYIRLWEETSIEFSNFTNNEIAQCMTSLTRGKYAFNAKEVEEFKGKTGNPLQKLSKEKIDYEISKIDLLGKMFDLIISEKDINKNTHRPIVALLKEIIDLAAKNARCQPISINHWMQNQDSGFFGDKVP